MSARTVKRRGEDMAADVKMLQAVALHSVALDESVVISGIFPLAIITRSCSDDDVFRRNLIVY